MGIQTTNTTPKACPSAVSLALMLPGGLAQALGSRSLGQLCEPSFDPEDPVRLLLELLTPQICVAAPHGEGRT